ncbi:MAG: 2-C-methyl-D-erythritol 4-phosphate cytidylyltransferase [Eubacteriales bacterium]|nr:2-C-methyl-D-erythritol 4-phosphate cytidylyltransferase [Eubacteriales bacterium]
MKEKCTAIVLAAGQGKRMGSKIQKQFLEIQGRPVLYYSLVCFEASPLIEEIVLVTGKDCIEYCQKEIVDKYNLKKVVKITAGGRERYDSVYAGLLACENSDYVFIHDGARPFIDAQILERAFGAAKECGACAVGMPSKDTVKIADENGYVADTPDRKTVWTIQTPQVFAYDVIRQAHEEIRRGTMQGITDDAMVVEQQGKYRVKMVEGSYKNMKITTPEDLLVAESFLKE